MNTPTPTRMLQPAAVGVFNDIHTTKCATKTFAAAAIPALTDFFQSAPSGDLTRDNYDQGGILITSGKTFTLYALALAVIPSTAATFSDIDTFLQRCTLVLTSQNKEIGVFPLIHIPAGGGAYAASSQLAVTAAAAPGAQISLGVTNGLPIRKLLELKQPLIIQSQQSFKVSILGPNSVPAGFPAATLAGALDVRIALEGIENRPAA